MCGSVASEPRRERQRRLGLAWRCSSAQHRSRPGSGPRHSSNARQGWHGLSWRRWQARAKPCSRPSASLRTLRADRCVSSGHGLCCTRAGASRGDHRRGYRSHAVDRCCASGQRRCRLLQPDVSGGHYRGEPASRAGILRRRRFRGASRCRVCQPLLPRRRRPVRARVRPTSGLATSSRR